MKLTKGKKTYKGKWYEFTPDWSGFSIKYHVAGYYDTRPMLQLYFIWGKLFIYLPWTHFIKKEREKTTKEKRQDKLKMLNDPKFKPKKIYRKEYYDECDPPRYGLYYHENQLVLCTGKNTTHLHMPWYLEWIRTSILDKNGNWIHETRGNRKEFWKDEWNDIVFLEKRPYQYTTKNGEIQNCIATIKVEKREWRWRWFQWLSWTKYIRKTIEVDFSEDIGEGKNSWKGGTTGCSYEMLKNETPYETLKRMERERKF